MKESIKINELSYVELLKRALANSIRIGEMLREGEGAEMDAYVADRIKNFNNKSNKFN